ncbi:MAG: MNIO family bufferin maturase [Sulfuriferula sp.]
MPHTKQLLQASLGFGLGLRIPHYETILESRPAVDWFEVLSENYMVPGGKPRHYLDRIRAHYPIVMHGVSLSIGSSDPLNRDYLRQLKTLADQIEPHWISDHLCWTGVDNTNLHDLLPLPYTEEALQHVVERVSAVQDILGRRLLLENVSSYVTYKNSEMSEWDFLREVAQRADSLLLLDINNIYVSSYNHGFDPLEYIDAIPVNRVQQFHLAGHRNQGGYIIDTHDEPVIDRVWDLYEHAVRRFGSVSTMIERDDNIPPLDELLTELERARSITRRALAQVADA